jgi:hypothetical protein
MNCRVLRVSANWLMVGGALLLGLNFAQAADATRVSGSYEIVQKVALGPQVQVRLKLHLINREPHELRIQRLTLWDFSHPDKGGPQPCSIVVPAQASADATQEFTIQRAEYESWKRGTRPRLVLELQTRDGRRATEVVRLDRLSSAKEN